MLTYSISVVLHFFKDLKRAMEVFSLAQRPARTHEEALQKSYQFWNTQPVPKMGWYNLVSFVTVYLVSSYRN